MDGGDSSANDTSVSHAKGQIAEYLARVHRESSADLRAELATAATAEFDAAPRHARPALAVAAQSREILERKCEGTQGPYARQQLVDVLVNIRGMSAARLLAAFAGKTPVAKQVRAYFERYPELAPADLAAAQKPATKKPAAKKPAARKPSPSR